MLDIHGVPAIYQLSNTLYHLKAKMRLPLGINILNAAIVAPNFFVVAFWF